MEQFLFCKFNMGKVYIEREFADGNMISINCIAVENEVAKNIYRQSELNYLIYNDLFGYAALIPNEAQKNI